MSTKRMVVAGGVLLVGVGCGTAQFHNAHGKRGAGTISPNRSEVRPEASPLDISVLEENSDQRHAGGPLAGTGERLSQTIELGCADSSGAIIEVNPSQADPNNAIQKLRLLGGPSVEIGKDGKPMNQPAIDPEGEPQDVVTGEEPLPPKPPIETSENANVIARVKGRFCPTSQNALTVLFVVDFSGSMGSHYPDTGAPLSPGYDPQIAGSCGRMRAAQAVMGKIKAARKTGDKVTVGMVPFAGGIVTEKMIKMIDAETFESQITKDSFCSYVIQHASFGVDPSNPGGMQSPGIDASTNYTAAFTAAKSLLSGIYGRKEVFFITDGEPTSGGADPTQAGIAAGTDLRESVGNLTLNALILGNPPASAEQVLINVAGSTNRMRKAVNADQLAEQIMSFPDASIDVATGKATLTILPYKPEAELGLRYLQQEAAEPGIWSYETQPFVLLGKAGEEVLHTVVISAKGVDGSTHQATVKLRYRQ